MAPPISKPLHNADNKDCEHVAHFFIASQHFGCRQNLKSCVK